MYYDLSKGYESRKCPTCDSESITFKGLEDCGHYIQQHCTCNKCGADLWFQFYLDGCYVVKEDE